jgi:hypothetical protein
MLMNIHGKSLFLIYFSVFRSCFAQPHNVHPPFHPFPLVTRSLRPAPQLRASLWQGSARAVWQGDLLKLRKGEKVKRWNMLLIHV